PYPPLFRSGRRVHTRAAQAPRRPPARPHDPYRRWLLERLRRRNGGRSPARSHVPHRGRPPPLCARFQNRSCRNRSPSHLPFHLPQVVVEVDFHRVAGRTVELLLVPPVVLGHLCEHVSPARQLA